MRAGYREMAGKAKHVPGKSPRGMIVERWRTLAHVWSYHTLEITSTYRILIVVCLPVENCGCFATVGLTAVVSLSLLPESLSFSSEALLSDELSSSLSASTKCSSSLSSSGASTKCSSSSSSSGCVINALMLG